MRAEFALDIQKVNKTYPNGFRALEDVALQVKQGDFFALLGPNGAGKSTLINVICSLTMADQGSQIKIFGYDLSYQIFHCKKMIGVMPQEPNLSGFDKVYDILSYQAGYYGISKKQADYRIDELLEKTHLTDKKYQIPLELSGGMRRRLMVARAMMHKPKLLILDEPTAGVDVELRKQMWDFISQINVDEKITIILTTHYLEEAESLCKNIAMIDYGKVVEQTSMKTLLRRIENQSILISVKEPLNEQIVNQISGSVLIDECTLKIKKHKNQSINEICQFFSEKSIEIMDIKPDKNRLETLFLDMIDIKNTKAKINENQ